MSETSPWGTRLRESESAPRSPWGTALTAVEPTVADFREVGLSESAARDAAQGVLAGEYLSFEDACLSKAMAFGRRQFSLNEALMRQKARAFTRGGS